MTPVCCDTCRGTNVGTEEELIGVALVTGYDAQTGEFAYTGETVVDYESSQTQKSEDGRAIMFCRDCCRHFLFDAEAASSRREGMASHAPSGAPVRPGRAPALQRPRRRVARRRAAHAAPMTLTRPRIVDLRARPSSSCAGRV
jgi:hypothetical protein